MAPPFSHPSVLADLTPREQQFVRMLRTWFAGVGARDAHQCNRVIAELRAGYGPAGGAALAGALARLVCVVGQNARRRFHYHQRCCPCLGGDEVLFLTLVGATALGRLGLARDTAGDIVQADLIGDLLTCASALAPFFGPDAGEVPELPAASPVRWQAVAGHAVH